MRGAARAGDDDLHARAARPLGEGNQPVGGAMGGNDPRVIADAEFTKRLRRAPHRRPVGLAAHHDGDGSQGRAHAASLVGMGLGIIRLRYGKGARRARRGPGLVKPREERHLGVGTETRGGEMTIHIQARALTDYCAEVFERVGCRPEEARQISASLVDANLTGHDSHGVIRVPRYVQAVRNGEVIPNQTVERLVDTPVIAVIDGRFGFGQTVAPQAVDAGIEKAKAMGLCAISLRNAGHVGRVGEWAERAAAAGVISIHFVNAAGSVLVAPFGGLERRLSTAPFCVGIPRDGAPPVVLDFATSLVAEGKVFAASRGGKPLPPNVLIGPDGNVSGDPAVLYGPLTPDNPRDPAGGTGAIRAFGEHKGAGLALICELLGGSLTGNGATELNRKFANGMFSLYVDPAQVDPAHVLGADMTRYLDWYAHVEADRGRGSLDARRARTPGARVANDKRRAAARRDLGGDPGDGEGGRRNKRPLARRQASCGGRVAPLGSLGPQRRESGDPA